MFELIYKNFYVDENLLKDFSFYTSFDRSQRYGLAMKNVNKVPLKIFNLSSEVQDKFLQRIPKQIIDIEVPEVIVLSAVADNVVNPSITAHVDYKRSCALNVYLNTNGETTHFYNWRQQTKDLEEIGKFQANQNECWLLDVSKPHAVMMVPNKKRTILSYSFSRTEFKKLRKILKETM